MRLHVFLAQAGVASRRAAERLITEGRVRLNGRIVRAQGTHVSPPADRVEVDGRPVAPHAERKRYFLFHKPAGVVTTLRDRHAVRTVADYFRDIPERLAPAGRLDKDSTGLVLMTNDGALIYRLTHPRYGVRKIYRVTVEGLLASEAVRQLEKGVWIEGRKTAPCRIQVLNRLAGRADLQMELREGRKREIREMMQKVGLHVVRLHRVAYGPLKLDDLRPGERRELTPRVLSRMMSVHSDAAEDAADLSVSRERSGERSLSFDTVLKNLKKANKTSQG